jgi:hypothetical protein
MPADTESSVTQWIGDLKAGVQTAALPLLERYFDRLVHLARGEHFGLEYVPREVEGAARLARALSRAIGEVRGAILTLIDQCFPQFT